MHCTRVRAHRRCAKVACVAHRCTPLHVQPSVACAHVHSFGVQRCATTHKYIMNRSIWKGPFTRIPIIQSRKGQRKDALGIIKVWSRAFMITPDDLSKTYLIYSGKRWVKVKVNQQMIGHRLGEFCTTRQATVHKVYKKKQTHRKNTLSVHRQS